MHPEPHNLTALAYGMIEGAERERLLEHLAACDLCRATYDSYRDEQAAVREAVIADARSGPAEARALERTLVMLGAAEEQPRGRLMRLPVWVWLSQAAALVAIAVGLFFIMNPEPEPRLVPVPHALRADAQVEQGKLLMHAAGQWREAEAVAVDEWVKAEEPTKLALVDGSLIELSNNTIIRLSYEGEARRPVVNVLSGSGSVTANGQWHVAVRGGETGLYALPGASVHFSAESWLGAGAIMRWEAPSEMHAQIVHGDAVLKSMHRRFVSLPMYHGETVWWTPQTIEACDPQGEPLPVDVPLLAFALKLNKTQTEVEIARKQTEVVFQRLRYLHENYRGSDVLFGDQPEQYLEALVALDARTPAGFVVQPARRVDGHSIYAEERDGELMFRVDEKQYQAATLNQLREKMPEAYRKFLAFYRFEETHTGWRVIDLAALEKEEAKRADARPKARAISPGAPSAPSKAGTGGSAR